MGYSVPAPQRELARVQEVLFEEFQKGEENGTQIWKRKGRILKVILFGSFAKGGWVEDRGTGYFSDFDIFVVVNYKQLGRTVNLVVETIRDMNTRLDEGHFFYRDVVTEGIALHEQRGHNVHGPALPADEKARARIAKEHYDIWMPAAASAMKVVGFCLEEGELKDGAFMLHQATEQNSSAA